jgi:hypothetical protein
MHTAQSYSPRHVSWEYARSPPGMRLQVWAAYFPSEARHLGIAATYLTLTLTLTLILLHQPETTATFGSIHRLCHSNYDLSTPTLVRSSDFGNKDPGFPALAVVVLASCLCSWRNYWQGEPGEGRPGDACSSRSRSRSRSRYLYSTSSVEAAARVWRCPWFLWWARQLIPPTASETVLRGQTN